MAVTDQDVLNEIQYATVEPVDAGQSFASGLWTVDEVIGYLNQVQVQFLGDTAALLQRTTLVAIPNTHRHRLPVNWILTQRVCWHGADGTFTELPRSDGWEADNGLPTWPYVTEPKPRVYMEAEAPIDQLQVAPGASDAGVVDLLYVGFGCTLGNAGETLTVPDECAAAIKYGTLALMFGKIGRGYDPARAAYCQARYEQFVEAVQIMIAGWR